MSNSSVVQGIALASATISLALEELSNHRHVLSMLSFETDNETEYKRKIKRTMWVRPHQTSALWLKFQNNLVVEKEWKENFRMSRESFFNLLDVLYDDLLKEDTRMRPAIKPAQRLAITLHYLHDEGRYRVTSNFFGVGISTVSAIVS